MKYLASFAAGIATAILGVLVYALLCSNITIVEMGWGGYWSIEAGTLPRLLAISIATFAVGFFWTLRRASR